MRARVHFSARKFLQAEAVKGLTALDSQQRGITKQRGVIPERRRINTTTKTYGDSHPACEQSQGTSASFKEYQAKRILISTCAVSNQFPPPPPPRPHTLSPTPRDYCIVRCNFVDESEWWGKYIWDLVPTGVDYSVIGVDIFSFFSLLGPHGAHFYLVWQLSFSSDTVRAEHTRTLAQ